MGNGKDFKKNGGSARASYQDKPLTTQPFRKDLKEFKPWGPACLVCGENIDTRVGSSVETDRNTKETRLTKGARRSQRQGYCHDRCLENTEQRTVVHSNLLSSLNEGSIRLPTGQFMDMVQNRGVVMEFPTYTESEMQAAVEAGEALPS